MTDFPNTTLQADPRASWAQMVAERTLRLLKRYAGTKLAQTAFYAIPEAERLILVFNPNVFGSLALPVDFVARLQRSLMGRRVVYTARRGIFVQVSYWPQAAPKRRTRELPSTALDLGKQASPTHVPLGVSRRGDEWRNIIDLDAVLIAGPRGKGKTRLMHAWIQALVHGGAAELLLWDRKSGNEFGRYDGLPKVSVVYSGGLDDDAALLAALDGLQQEILRRAGVFSQVGATNLAEYNARAGEPLAPLVLFIDEAADLTGETAAMLARLVRLARAYGVHPVVGVQRPDAEVMKGQLRANLPSRICFSVVSHQDSKIALGYTGAEKLPKVVGRFLVTDNAELLEVQAYQVGLPERMGSAPGVGRVSLLSAEERRMVQAALELDGWFNIAEIGRKLGIDSGRVGSKARAWAERGLLTKILYEKKGEGNPRRLGRRVTKDLLQMAGLTGFTDLQD